jgi:hypothetical protein
MSADTYHDQSFAQFMRSLGAAEIEHGLPLTKVAVMEAAISFLRQRGTWPTFLIVHPCGRADLFHKATMGEVDFIDGTESYMGLKIGTDCSLARTEVHFL